MPLTHAKNFFTDSQRCRCWISADLFFIFTNTSADLFTDLQPSADFYWFSQQAVLLWQLADFHDNDNRRKKSCQPCKYKIYFLTSNNENYSLQVKSLKHLWWKIVIWSVIQECLIRVFNQRHSCKTIQNNPFKLLWCKSCQRKEERLQGSDMPHTVSAYLKIRKQLCITLTLLGLEDRFQE